MERGRILAALRAIWMHRIEVEFKGKAISPNGVERDIRGLVSRWRRGACEEGGGPVWSTVYVTLFI